MNAGVQPAPGFTYQNLEINYNTNTFNDASGQAVAEKPDLTLWVVENWLIYVTHDAKLLGGNLGFAIIVPTIANGSVDLAQFEQPDGWTGEKISRDMPAITNLRQDPFERTRALRRESQLDSARSATETNSSLVEFWRFVMVQKSVAQLAMTAVDYPPMQGPASFNLDAIKKDR